MLDTLVITLLLITLAALFAASLAFFIGYILISLPAAVFGLVDDWGVRRHRTHHLRPAH